MNFLIRFLVICIITAPIVSPIIIAIIYINQRINKKYDPSHYYMYCNSLEHKGTQSNGVLTADQVFERKTKSAQMREHASSVILLMIILISVIISTVYLAMETAVGDWIYSLMSLGIFSILPIFIGLVLCMFLIFLVSCLIYIFAYCGIILIKNKIRGRIRRHASLVKVKEYSNKNTR